MRIPLIIDESLPSHAYLELLEDNRFKDIVRPTRSIVSEIKTHRVHSIDKVSIWAAARERLLSK